MKMGIATRMGFALDSAVSIFAPSAAARRMQARLDVASTSARMYAAAKPTADAGGWLPMDGDVNSLISSSSPVVRARVRQLVRDFPYGTKALRLYVVLLVGKGIRMQARLRDANGKLDRAANARLESSFARWCENASVCGKLSFTELQELAVRQWGECGEFLFIKRYLKGDRYPFRLQAVEPDRLNGDVQNFSTTGATVRDGIEFDRATGKRLAYHIMDDGFGARTVRVPAEDVIHGYEVHRAGQLRGISPIASAVMVAGNLSDLLEAELEAMRMASRIVGFLEGSTPAAPAQRPGQQAGKPVEYYDHATIQYLRHGERLTLAKIDRQTGTFQPYLDFNIRTFAVGCDLPHEWISGNYTGLNYSNFRGVRQDLAESLKPRHRMMINQLCRPAAHAWLQTAMLQEPELIPLARRIEPGCLTWLPPGLRSVDPLKENKAAADGMKNLTVSPQILCAEQGRDLEEVMDQLQEAKELADERGLAFGQVDTSEKTNPAALTEKDNAES